MWATCEFPSMLLHFLRAKPSRQESFARLRGRAAPQYKGKGLLQLAPPPPKKFLSIWLLLRRSLGSQQSPSPSFSHTTEGRRQKLTLQKPQHRLHLLQSTQQGKRKRRQHHNRLTPAAQPHPRATAPNRGAGLACTVPLHRDATQRREPDFHSHCPG